MVRVSRAGAGDGATPPREAAPSRNLQAPGPAGVHVAGLRDAASWSGCRRGGRAGRARRGDPPVGRPARGDRAGAPLRRRGLVVSRAAARRRRRRRRRGRRAHAGVRGPRDGRRRVARRREAPRERQHVSPPRAGPRRAGARRRARAPMFEHQQLRWFRTMLLGRTPGSHASDCAATSRVRPSRSRAWACVDSGRLLSDSDPIGPEAFKPQLFCAGAVRFTP